MVTFQRDSRRQPVACQLTPPGDVEAERWVVVKCKTCGSEELRKFTGELAIHFPGLKELEKPIVWVFPRLLVCLNCGSGEFAVPETELRALSDSAWRDVSELAGRCR